MKNLIKISILSLALILGITACQKDDQQYGRVEVQMTDAPADFIEVNINVQEVWAHYAGANGAAGVGWVRLDAVPGYYDLLTLQNGVTDVIANPTTIPVGHITQLRLKLGDDNYAVEIINDVPVQHPLLLSSQDETGLKINLKSEIRADQTIVITLDFDAGESIIEQGNGGYRLKPVVKLESVSYIP